MAPTRHIHIDENQKEILFAYMRRNPEFSDSSTYAKRYGREKSKSMWEELAEILNSQDTGARKDPRDWKDTWSAWKTKVRSKAREIRAHMQGIVGVRIHKTPLTPIERSLLVFIGNGELIGMENTPESDLSINVKSSPGEEVEGEIPFVTMECTIDALDRELNSAFEDDSLQSLTSAHKDAVEQQLHSVEAGLKRKAVSTGSPENAKRSQFEHSGYARVTATLEERTLVAAESTARSVAALVALCNRHADAAERTAGAAERRARAAERLADAAERQAFLAENAARKAAR